MEAAQARTAALRGEEPGAELVGRLVRSVAARLQRALYLSAQVGVFFCPISKAYYGRKRKEGKGHKQAVIAPARRRVEVLWAMIRDHVPFQAAPAVGNVGCR
ncbi:hypothetical protein G3I37_28720 [Streptomyces anulatus]|uniref:IS110 family transposase n=1 Tax=Streptomyces anulatus TaxID=1892 RepID=A0A7K3R8Z6_STRAQ|nr:hypothetical protein [Streptomyces anulatus]NED28836.1 hypothetical protein [Streptomyces anulatus]